MPPEADTSKLSDRICKLARAIAQLEPGPLARLRRMRPDGPGTAEFWKLVLDNELRADSAGLRFVVLLALLTPKGAPGAKRLHDAEIPFGRALAAAKYPEARLLRFLATPFEARPDALESMVRWLAAKRHDGVNCLDLANLLWVDDVEHERRLAHFYFAELKKHSEKKDQAA
ncbi:MAG: hypothetical protein LDL25_01880 [Hyphomicrobiales bacterium]|uniref:hypothetical protein n=1 Tax=Rhabdaerophilum calidifontis TaxID=2604328 RepID=UPI00140A8E59|nr:hypothetical protein [Rhabdaerophilum calidifontis]MCA1951554.1 hypothetical protein [Hyphomicrobiales bacterium]MCA1998516.1 hypothetical protein [Hyphomicrobiales bacterium]